MEHYRKRTSSRDRRSKQPHQQTMSLSPAESSSELEPPVEDYEYQHDDPLTESERLTSRIARRTNVTAEAAPYDISYRPGRVLLYSPPRQRQRWNDTQVLPRVNWGYVWRIALVACLTSCRWHQRSLRLALQVVFPEYPGHSIKN